MRKIIASVNITLDGFMAGADGNLNWHFDYWDGQLGDSLCRLLDETDTILLGANTYRGFAEYWPAKASDPYIAKDDIVLAEIMNRHTKVVISKTIEHAFWRNTTLLKGKLKTQIDQLKQQQGSGIIVLGSHSLITSLMKYRLIDRYELWLHPVSIGQGKRLFSAMLDTTSLRLVNKQTFDSGVVRLSYEVSVKS